MCTSFKFAQSTGEIAYVGAQPSVQLPASAAGDACPVLVNVCAMCVSTAFQPVYPDTMIAPCTLVDTMVECSLSGEVVEATAGKLLHTGNSAL
jgi:hypothetical protein